MAENNQAALDSLFQEVINFPTANEPRENYLQAVSEADPAYADFIWLQLENDRLERRLCANSFYLELKKRYQKLLTPANNQKWSDGIKSLVKSWTFNRGFVERVTLSPEYFIENGAKLLQLAPILHLIFEDATVESLQKLAQFPLLQQIYSISLERNPVGNAGLAALLTSPYLTSLRWLNFKFTKLDNEGLEILAATPNLPALEYISVYPNSLDDPVDFAAVDQGAIIFHDSTAKGIELENRYGPKKWLHWNPYDTFYLYPEPYRFVPLAPKN